MAKSTTTFKAISCSIKNKIYHQLNCTEIHANLKYFQFLFFYHETLFVSYNIFKKILHFISVTSVKIRASWSETYILKPQLPMSGATQTPAIYWLDIDLTNPI